MLNGITLLKKYFFLYTIKLIHFNMIGLQEVRMKNNVFVEIKDSKELIEIEGGAVNGSTKEPSVIIANWWLSIFDKIFK